MSESIGRPAEPLHPYEMVAAWESKSSATLYDLYRARLDCTLYAIDEATAAVASITVSPLTHRGAPKKRFLPDGQFYLPWELIYKEGTHPGLSNLQCQAIVNISGFPTDRSRSESKQTHKEVRNYCDLVFLYGKLVVASYEPENGCEEETDLGVVMGLTIHAESEHDVWEPFRTADES